jgi:hypothetical protein
MPLKLSLTMYLSNWVPRDAPHFELKKYLSNWAPWDASQVEPHYVFIKLSSTRCFSSCAPRGIPQIELHEMLKLSFTRLFLKLSSTWWFSSWAPLCTYQIELHEMPIKLGSTRCFSSWAARDVVKVPCSWRSLEICIWPYVVIGPASLPWGVPLQLLNFSYDADLCFMYYHIT